MKVIQKQELITKNIYVAYDGREFDSEADCHKYENDSFELLYNKLKKIPHYKTNSNNLFMDWGLDDEEVLVLIPRSEEDVDIMRKMAAYMHEDFPDHNLVGKVVAVRLGYDYDYFTLYEMEPYIADAIAHLYQIVQKVRKISAEADQQ